MEAHKEEKAMLDTKVAELLNTQVNKEFYSAYLYLDFSNYYMDQGLEGFGNWYKIQAQEERDHAMLFMQYLQNNGCKVTLEAIDKGKLDMNQAVTASASALEGLPSDGSTANIQVGEVMTVEHLQIGRAHV